MSRKPNVEALELFFNTFINTELDDEINLPQWINGLTRLSMAPRLSEREMIAIFKCIEGTIDRAQGPDEGFIDVVDFIRFCTAENEMPHTSTKNVKLQNRLRQIIESHPFVQR